VIERIAERQFQDTVVQMAGLLGWLVFHDQDSRRNVAGFPDLVLVHPEHGVLWLELKTMVGRVRADQRIWIDALVASGQRAYIVRPSDMDAIERLLRGAIARLEDAA
jgi:hypothetical protein